MTRFDVTAFGEAMLRLSVPPGIRLEMANQLDLHIAGAESNVLSLLSRLGRCCGWLSALPISPLGRLAANQLRLAGVDLSEVVWDKGCRLGAYYVEFATPPRSTQVIYDRAYSCITQLTVDKIAWDYLLDTHMVHFTGITPALSPSCHQIAVELMTRAKAAHKRVSFDINYRSKLWSSQEAAVTLMPLIQGVDLLLCSQSDAQQLFQFHGTPKNIVHQLAEMSQAQCVILTLAEEGVLAWDGTEWHHQPAQKAPIVDRIGAGDALAAGIIHGWLDGDFEHGLRYGTMLAALALSQYGDLIITNPEELNGLLREEQGKLLR